MSETNTIRVFDAKSQPRRVAPSQLVFRYDKGSFSISVSLYRTMGGDAVGSVAILQIGKGYYITRADQTRTGWWLHCDNRKKSGTSSILVQSKANVQHLLRDWHYGPGDVVAIAVTNSPIEVDDPALDRTAYPYPLYRLIFPPTTGAK